MKYWQIVMCDYELPAAVMIEAHSESRTIVIVEGIE